MSKGDTTGKRRPRTARIDEDFIKIVAQSVPDLPPLRSDVPRALAADAEYRLRELIQRAKSFMVHSKRRTLAVQDISAALRHRDTQPVLGYGAGEHTEFRNVQGSPGLYVLGDDVVKLQDVITAQLPARGLCPIIEANWIALEGKEVTNIYERAQVTAVPNGLPENIRKEFGVFAKTVEGIIGDAEAEDLDVDAALREVAAIKTIHPILPHLIAIIRQKVHENARACGRTEVLFNATRLIYAILSRNRFGVEAYYDQILPPLLTCLLGRRLGRGDHWSLRDFAAFVVQETFRMHVDPVSRGRTAKTIVAVLTDKQAPLESIYGAIRGLAALGQDVFRFQFLPHLPAVLFGLDRAAVASDKLEGNARTVVDEKISHVCQAIEDATSSQGPEDVDATHLMDMTL